MDKTIDVIIQERLDSDTVFLDSIKDFSDEDKNSSIESKKKELLESEFKTLSERAKEVDQAKDYAKNEKIRAEKAEAELKKRGENVVKSDSKDLKNISTKDFYALTKANVSEEDIDDVSEYASFKNISVAEALKSPIIKATLREKAESRKTAAATNTGTTRSQNTKPDGHSILERAKSKGEEGLPDSGTDEAQALFEARFEKRTGRKFIAS